MKKIVIIAALLLGVTMFTSGVTATEVPVQQENTSQIQLVPDTVPAEIAQPQDNNKVDKTKEKNNTNKKSSSTEKKTGEKKSNGNSSSSSKKSNSNTKFVKANKERDYVVKVNLAQNCVTVYTEENGELKPFKAMACSSGRDGHDTPEGEFKTYEYYESRLMVDNTYGRYAVRFNGQIMFHSVPYLTTAKDSLEWDQYNLLGERASLGCIRLCVGDAKWIYDNCKKGTKVVVYSDKSTPGPLGKPKVDKIPEKSPNRNWDPTDLTPENPWLVVVE